MHSIFKLREKETDGIIELLESVTLGTNGAHYRHLDTAEKMKQSDKPLFLSMERNERVLGNITFCRRSAHWYIRYFATSPSIQSTGKVKSKGNKTSLLKRELSNFFQEVLSGESAYGQVESFYAYIDPRNEKSLWMSENFGFETVGKIATQTYSRVNPKSRPRVEKADDWNLVKGLVENQFKAYNYFFLAQTEKPPFYIIRDKQGEIIACAKTSVATWEIKRLPGKWGGVLTKLIPFIPRLNKLIRPKKHTFIVPEAVIVKNNDPKLVNELFEGILDKENRNLLIWWVDQNDGLYTSVRSQMKWGLLHKLVGVNSAHVVRKQNATAVPSYNSEQPFYTSGFDFI